MFVSRLHAHSKVAEVEDCARRPTIIGDKLKIIDVHCEKLKSRYEHLYSSCHLQVRVKSADMKCAIDLSMSNTSWPQGLFVKIFQAKGRWPCTAMTLQFIRLTVGL